MLKALNTSNDTVLAMGANLSVSADSHLVAIQQDDGTYQTQAINICNKVSIHTLSHHHSTPSRSRRGSSLELVLWSSMGR